MATSYVRRVFKGYVHRRECTVCWERNSRSVIGSKTSLYLGSSRRNSRLPRSNWWSWLFERYPPTSLTFLFRIHMIFFPVARFGELRNDNDPNCTYEGENNVLLQQTSNWLLAMRRNGYKQFKEVSPLGSAVFLANFDSIMKQKFQSMNSKEAVAAESA